MKAFQNFALSLAAGAALVACATTPSVKLDSDPATDFSRYHNYSLVFSSPPAGQNALVFQRIQDKIDRALSARGYVKAEPADFAVAFTVGARDKIHVEDYGIYGRGYYGGYYGGWRGGYGGADVYQTREGSLSINIFDASTQKPVWFATLARTISEKGATEEQIDEAVNALIAKFPPTTATAAAN